MLSIMDQFWTFNIWFLSWEILKLVANAHRVMVTILLTYCTENRYLIVDIFHWVFSGIIACLIWWKLHNFLDLLRKTIYSIILIILVISLPFQKLKLIYSLSFNLFVFTLLNPRRPPSDKLFRIYLFVLYINSSVQNWVVLCLVTSVTFLMG